MRRPVVATLLAAALWGASCASRTSGSTLADASPGNDADATVGPDAADTVPQGDRPDAPDAPDALADQPIDTRVTWDGSGSTCGEIDFPQPPISNALDIIIAFDDSKNMDAVYGMGTRYTTARDLLLFQIEKHLHVRWGYVRFPAPITTCPPSTCCARDVSAAPGSDPRLVVVPEIKRHEQSSGATPIAAALAKVGDFYASFMDGVSHRYVILSTQGWPSCPVAGAPGGTCDEAVTEVEKLLAAGIKTIVLGFSDGSSELMCLNRLAMAGGEARPTGPPHFFPGRDAVAFDDRLGNIVNSLARPSCSFDLASPPPDPARVAVLFDGAFVPWDRFDGWDFAPGSTSRVAVGGSWCRKLLSFGVSTVTVRFGCPVDM